MKLKQEPVRKALVELCRTNTKAFDIVLDALRSEAEAATDIAIEGTVTDRETRCGTARAYRAIYSTFRAARED